MNVVHIIRREYSEHVRKKSFVVSTILVPIFMLAFLVVPILLTFMEPNERLSVAVIDYTDDVGVRFASAFDDTTDEGELKYDFRLVPAGEATKHEMIVSLNEGALDILLEIPGDVVDTGEVEYITKDVRNFQILESFNKIIKYLLSEKFGFIEKPHGEEDLGREEGEEADEGPPLIHVVGEVGHVLL